MSGDLTGETRRVSMEDDGREVVIAPGDRLELRLPEIPGTAFQWSATPNALLTLDHDEMEAGAAPGGGGVRVLAYRATSAGSTQLELLRHRPWEPPESADARFTLRVEVE